MERRILDGNGRLTMFLCVLVFLYDRYRTHSRTIYGSSTPLQRTPGIKSAKNDLIYEEQMLRVKFFESFITKRKMVCESVLYFAVIVLTAASLLNFFEKSFMVPLLLKFLLLWYISTYKFNFHYNLQKKHVLRDLVESPEIFFRLSYWMWLIPRIISSDRFRFVNPSIESNGMGEAVLLQITFLLCEMCYYYPCYYFYYKDPFNETNDIFESLKFTPRQDIFVLSTLLQWAIPHLLLNFFYMVALGTPKIPRWGKKAIDHVIDFDSKFFVPLLSRLLQCNAYISYAHVIWYYFYGNSTTAVLLCIAIGNYIAHNSAEHSLQLLLHKSMPREYYRPRFVRYFTLLHMRKHSKHYENHKCEHKSDKKITDDVSLLFSDIFEAMLDKTAHKIILEAARPDFFPLEPVELPSTNIGGGERFQSPFVNLFESMYLECFLPIYEMDREVERSCQMGYEDANKTGDEEDNKTHMQADSLLMPLQADRAYYENLIGMELS